MKELLFKLLPDIEINRIKKDINEKFNYKYL